jgi:uroporphyrinogen decarboxylase
MTGKQRVLRTLAGLETDRLPWVPFTGVHAGKLTGHSARQVSTDVEALVEAQLEVNRLYRPDGQPVMFDLQIEAEILGCSLVWSEDAPPSVASHPLADSEEIPTYIPAPSDGRLALELAALRCLKTALGESTALYGICCGPFTLASHVRGTDIFMDMILEPQRVHGLLAYTTRVATAVATYLAQDGADVVAVVDPLISQISPEHFEEFMLKPFGELFSSIRSTTAKSSFFVCGNATRNIEPMCRTGCDSISVDENVDLPLAKTITDRFGITVGGNLPLTTVMLFGNQQDNMKAVVDMIDRCSPGHLIVSPGCDMPYDIPVENAIAAEHAVHETESARRMVAGYQSSTIEFTGTLPDYGNLARPLVEVFTLDSATCAACTYMMAATRDAVEQASVPIDVVEYKYTVPENIARCKVMGVKQLPSIYINGQLAFSSIIPSRDELLKRLAAVAR